MDEKLLEFENNFSVLDRYGTDITKEEYVTNPAIGRDNEIKNLILVLLTPEKSAILIGKPGIGKTAIVEGLAYLIQQDKVPEALKGYTILNIKTASLLGTMPSGESKVQKMIDELKQREKVILFIDEIHMLIGATDSSSLDFANIFKEGLGRGSIKVIGATTTEEYEKYILRDKAFTRRFQKIEVPEPSPEEVVKIMMGTLPKFEKQTGRKMKYTSFIQERIMTFIVDITSEYKRVYALGSRYPDVSLTILKQAFSYTVFDNREFMDIFDVRKAIENSKNIYPDIIRKELPNFDREFKDLMEEESGTKEIEAWRKLENNENVQKADTYLGNENRGAMIAKNLEILKEQKEKEKATTPVEKKELKVEKPTHTKEYKNYNEKAETVNLDNSILGSDLGVIEQDRTGINMLIGFKADERLLDDDLTDSLLSKPISSILDNDEVIRDIETYKKNEANSKGTKPKTIDIRKE